jgi:hypothetical protein
MKLRHNIKKNTVYILLAFVGLTILAIPAMAQIDVIDKQALEHYQPDTWKKSTEPPILGLRLDDFRIDGFSLKEKRNYPATGGTDYLFYNEQEYLDLHVIINVYTNIDEAHNGLYNWLTMGTNVLMQKGSFSSVSNIIGDISWVGPSSFALAFIRDNLVVIMYGMTRIAQHLELIEEIASSIDETIKTEPRMPNAAENIKRINPIIDSLVLEKTTLPVNERTKILIIARDPRGGNLEFTFHSTGGNILTTKDGYFYQATIPGEHTITVFAKSPYNLRSKKSVTVIVEK